jgi:hypothetical protein
MSQARQADFDVLVKEMLEEGASVEEAAAEAEEVFKSSGYDMSALYIYTTALELKAKEQMENNIRVLEDTAVSKNSILNSTFAMQGLKQTLSGDDLKQANGALKLLQARNTIQTVVSILKQTSESDENEKDNSDGEESDDDDADENRILQKTALINFAVLVLTKLATCISSKSLNEKMALTEENVELLCKLVDEDSGEPRYGCDSSLLQ